MKGTGKADDGGVGDGVPRPYAKELKTHAMRIADATCKAINETVPESVDGMPYARQYVLEEAIKILQERV